MTQELADSSHLLADKTLHEKDTDRSVRTYARKLFAEIAVRILAYGADLVVTLFAMIFLGDRVFNFIGLGDELRTAIWALMLVAYFTAILD